MYPGKAIVLLLAYFDETGHHGSRAHHPIEIDHFFWGTIAPGESFVLSGAHREIFSAGKSDISELTLRRTADPLSLTDYDSAKAIPFERRENWFVAR